MVAVHRQLLAELDPPRPVFLDATFGFQENADELVAKAQEYFDVSLHLPLEVASARRASALSALERGRFLETLAWGNYLFAGPGSPSYGLAQLRTAGAGPVLRERLVDGATVVLASAAALTAGRYTIPVYEIYKVGEDPRWLDGLDLLDAFGVTAAVVPHYDNKEGATHDTRFCYIGERRLRLLEDQLPPGVGILGIDEHTAVVLDGSGKVRVLGKGRLVLRVRGNEHAIAAPATLALDELRDRLGATDHPRPGDTASASAAGDLAALDEAIDRGEITDALGQIAALVGVDDDRVVTGLARLARRLTDGLVDREAAIAPVVEAIIARREAARAARDFALGDHLRDALAAGGVIVEDTPEGTRWRLAEVVH
ncbi:cysteinyl-tRNA synthetase-like protein [Acidimicrobium ferrooxidans DSM 10331]|uniref:Cysteinyl-tRNA synthetase-like protein n=1 Tax=Acidimicrobium ferrooxidans (strain DSM 10331 / JCM 15462 / NBRC 103882 / ICP) TaxID=525909 RepID=C7M1U7_ACIFD|nr:cysteinyl-tRNA synthetase-like protein [Acidimicrobium ferrooxidans DSM 10331]